MNIARHNADLVRLRSFRNRTDPDLSIGQPLAAASERVLRQHRTVGGIAEAWDRTVPAHITRHCTLVGLSRGTLTIRAADASTRFHLDRFLRTGGQAELARCANVAIRRIKLL